MRERREGALDWGVRMVASVPARAASIVRGFVHEVIDVIAASARFIAVRVPGASRLARASQRPSRTLQHSSGQPGAWPRLFRAGARDEIRTGDEVRHAPRSEAKLCEAKRRRERLRKRTRIVLAILLAASIGAAWIYVPASDLFRIRHVEVTGASAVGDLEIRERIDSLLAGKTVFTVDDDALVDRLEELPFVREVRVERHLPGGLQLHVREYRPLALGYGDGKFWLVARDGRILARARQEEWLGRVPTVTLEGNDLAPGVRVGDEPALLLLGSRTSDSTLAFDVVKATRYQITGRLVDGIEVRFGRPQSLRQKVLVAEKVLREARRAKADLLYIDVSVPSRPAFCIKTDAACLQPRGGAAAARAAQQVADGVATPEESGGDEAAPALGAGTSTATTNP